MGIDQGEWARLGADDRAHFGLETTGDGTAAFTLRPELTRLDGRMYGGTAMAVAIAVAEQVTDRPALWCTVQFVSPESSAGDRIDLEVDVRAHGRRASQFRVSGRRGDDLLFEAVGACALPKEGAPEGAFPTMPAVLPPEECPGADFPVSSPDGPPGFVRQLEIRRTLEAAGRPGPHRMWVRLPGRAATATVLGFVSDWVPSAVVQALGGRGGGTSLDNTLRLAFPTDEEWVLIDFDPHAARGGYGHGAAHLWSRSGTYLGTASQTSTLIILG